MLIRLGACERSRALELTASIRAAWTGEWHLSVLLTNDSGHRATGIELMRRALIDAGLEVVTVAPAREWGVSGNLVAEGLPETIERAGGDSDNPVFTIEGSPLQCVQVAVGMGLVRNGSVIVAGISEASRSTHGAAASSTLKAAIEGALLGYPSIAISRHWQGDRSRARNSAADDLGWCGVIGAELAAWLGVSPPPVRSVLNVRVPGVLRDRRLKLASSESDGSDMAAVASGHVCIAPMNLAGGMGSAVRLFDWARQSLATLDARIGASEGRCLAGCCG